MFTECFGDLCLLVKIIFHNNYIKTFTVIYKRLYFPFGSSNKDPYDYSTSHRRLLSQRSLHYIEEIYFFTIPGKIEIRFIESTRHFYQSFGYQATLDILIGSMQPKTDKISGKSLVLGSIFWRSAQRIESHNKNVRNDTTKNIC